MQLSQREQWAVAAAGTALTVFLLLQFLVLPLVDRRARLEKGLVTRAQAVTEMRAMQDQYRALTSRSGSLAAALAAREAGFSLFSFLEKNADDSGVREKIAHMKPSESTGSELFTQSQVEMKLQAVSLGQLVRFLERVESPAHLVGIDKIAIQENTREKGLLDVTLQLVSIDQVVGAAPR